MAYESLWIILIWLVSLSGMEVEWSKKLDSVETEMKGLRDRILELENVVKVKDETINSNNKIAPDLKSKLEKVQNEVAESFIKGFEEAKAQVTCLNPSSDISMLDIFKTVIDEELVEMPDSEDEVMEDAATKEDEDMEDIFAKDGVQSARTT